MWSGDANGAGLVEPRGRLGPVEPLDPVDVVYVAGDGRSGSTLLSQMLALVPGWVGVGEVRYVWQRGLLQNRVCECGQAFADCAFWTRVMEEGFGGGQRIPAREIVDATERLLRTRRSLAALRSADDPARWAAKAPEAVAHTAVLYRAIRQASGAGVVVDSSKLATYAHLLRATGAVRLFVIHLVRDPRATVHSWRRHKALHEDDQQRTMHRRSLARSCAVWNSGNLLVEGLLGGRTERMTRLRYEDMVTDPGAALREAVADLGLPARVPDLDPGRVQLPAGHAAAGNPGRHARRPVALRLDDSWRTNMPHRNAMAVAALTQPLMRRYGYA